MITCNSELQWKPWNYSKLIPRNDCKVSQIHHKYVTVSWQFLLPCFKGFCASTGWSKYIVSYKSVNKEDKVRPAEISNDLCIHVYTKSEEALRHRRTWIFRKLLLLVYYYHNSWDMILIPKIIFLLTKILLKPTYFPSLVSCLLCFVITADGK